MRGRVYFWHPMKRSKVGAWGSPPDISKAEILGDQASRTKLVDKLISPLNQRMTINYMKSDPLSI